MLTWPFAGASWPYLPVVVTTVQMLLTISAGVAFGHFSLVPTPELIDALSRYLHNVAVPAQALLVLGVTAAGSNAREPQLLAYVGAWFALRVLALLAAALLTLGLRARGERGRAHARATARGGLGDVAARWLALAWASTVALGGPIVSALTCSASKGFLWGMLAAITSYAFMLPSLLWLLECHREASGVAQRDELASGAPGAAEAAAGWRRVAPSVAAPRSGSWRRARRYVLRTPVLLCVAVGASLALARVALSDRLPAPAEQLRAVVGTLPRALVDRAVALLSGLSWSITPVALFSMGLWAQHVGLAPIRDAGPLEIGAHVLAKCAAIPLLMAALALALGLDDEPGRMAVLLSALPITMAPSTLVAQYGLDETFLAANVLIGLLLLPVTVLAVLAALDAAGLFLVPPVAACPADFVFYHSVQ